ncbi:MAG: mechanosensitive ion channel [Desulfobacterales bacterium]|nr:MAG: mechanosensitive ion channel [Desulfobacterales bacterium]
MHSIMKKLVGLFIISSLYLLPVILPPPIQAQQTATPPSTTAPSPAISIEELKSRRIAIESMTDIDASVKNDSLKYIDQAIKYLELADNINKKANELSQLIQTAPERLKISQVELKKPFTAPEKVEARAQQMSTLNLEQRVRQKEAELATAQTRLREWSDRLTAEKAIINQAPEQLATATSRIKDIQTELETTSGAAETDILNHSKVLSLRSEREKLTAEIKLNELRQRSHNLLVELFSTERDIAQKAVESREKMLKSWQADVQKRRQQEAAQAREDAQDAIVKAPLLPKIVQDQFDINIELSAELEKITQEETVLAGKYEDYQSRLKALEEEFETAKKRVESAVLTEAIGLALRTQRLNLPNADQYFADSDARQIRMSEISERQIELGPLLRELSDPKALADRVIASVSFLSDVDRRPLDLKIQQLVANRLDIIQKLTSGYDRIFKLIQDIEFTEQKLVNTAEDFGELLDRHLLWIRSSKPVGIGDIQKLKVSLGWFFEPASWNQLLKDVDRSFRQKTAIWIIGLLIGLFLIVSRRWARRKLKDIAECVEQQVEDSFLLTIKALGLTVVLAAVWPFLLAFPAIQLTNLRPAYPFSAGIAGGLIYATRILIFLVLFYNICRKYGLAQAHFQWPESARRIIKRNLGWFIPISTVTSFFIGAMETVPEFEYSDALAKLALMIQTLALSTFAARTLRFRGGITSVLIEKQPQSWLCRLRYVWYPLAILLPLFIFCLAVIGYFYSAIEIRNLTRNTIGLFFVLIVFNDLMRRMLVLARRRIALKKAFANQNLHQESTSRAEAAIDPGGGTRSSQMETIVEMSQIDEQTRKLLKLVVFILALAGIWAIWEPVFPAFGILQDIQFWSYSTVVDGVAKTVPITLANIFMAVIVAVTTIIASRNLPGLLEVILLNRLPMDPGARYAYSTVCRYTITAIGIIIVFNTIGIKWASLQWLIAALGVGLGFGLQEIVANFICGLIVLFERPFRVGDTVTIGDISGTVSRIRIRATTVVDWDRKELIVPNKEFVVGRLINWSLSDKYIRIRIPVGIAYGSDTKLAEELLLQAARKNPHVLSEPAPDAVFKGFGDNSLDFELRVYINGIENWYPMLHKLNVTIDNAFKEAGVTIAFPQRDVHLDATGPLEVRVVAEPPQPLKTDGVTKAQ